MSARQPFLPSRPASRPVNAGEETSAATSNVTQAVSNNTSSSSEKNHLELGESTRAFNISGFKKKSAPRTASFGSTGDPGNTAHTQNQAPAPGGGGVLARASSGTKGSSTTRIYAPRPFTPPTTLFQGIGTGFPGPEFKKPSLPFASKSVDEAATSATAQNSVETGTRPPQLMSNADTTAGTTSNLFRPMSCRPQDEVVQMNAVPAPVRRPPSRPSFFGGGGAQFSFDGVTNSLDDSGYFSSVSEHNDNEGDRLAAAAPANRNDALRNFANQAKRIRPASPGDREDIVLDPRSNELSKRPCVRRSPLRSHGSPSQAAPLGRMSPADTQTFTLPPNVPHPTAAIGDFPGLEFSDADLGHYAELYEEGAERWSKSTMEDWLSGANDIMAKFTEMMDMIRDHMSSKVNLYKSLHTKLGDEHASLGQRAKELRDASHALVRDSGSIGGGLDANGLEVRTC